MNTLKRTYVAPIMMVSKVRLESPICSGSVFSPAEEKITIHKQGFADKDDGWDGDFTGDANWTPSPTGSNQ